MPMHSCEILRLHHNFTNDNIESLDKNISDLEDFGHVMLCFMFINACLCNAGFKLLPFLYFN